MADESRNPADNFTWRELVKGLGAFSDKLDALDKAQVEASRDTRATRRAVEKAPKEQARIAAATRRAGTGEVPTEPAEVARVADSTEQRARNEERITRAYRDRSGLIVAERRTSDRVAAEGERRAAEGRRRGTQEALRLQRQLYARGGTAGVLDPRLQIAAPQRRGTIADSEIALRAADRRAREAEARDRQARIREAERSAPNRARSVLSYIDSATVEREVRPLATRIMERMAAAKLATRGITDAEAYIRERLGTTGGGGGQPPIVPPAPPAPGGGDDFEKRREIFRSLIGAQRQEGGATEELDAKQKALNTSREAAAQAEARYKGSLAEATRTLGLSSDAMRRHGALTTEFISAAAKGQVTFRELGFQVGATIAKFAGWTAAASAVYGAAAAITSLGSGAIDSLTGVTQLQRVVGNINTKDAQREFRALSREFNVPIGTVTEAAFEAARIFKDQDSIFRATRATLGGVAVAELTAAQSGQFLNAIQRGLGLSAKDLNQVLDSANQITNEFGGNTAGIVEGTAKAAGAFRNAKGAGEDYRDLLALIASGQAATGRTGAEVGTALRRSAEIVLRPDRRQKLIDLLGVDPKDTGFVALYRRAMVEVQKAMKSGDKTLATQIAVALSTPELASGRILPILQNPQFFEQRRGAAGPRSEGSVAREVAVKNESIRQQLAAIAVNLQDLGSALASSGFLDTLGGGVKLLNKTLQLATDLVEIFNEIPDGLRQGLLIFGQYAAVMATLRRLDVGATIAQRFPTVGDAFRRRPDRLERAQTLQGLGDQRKFFEEQRRVTSQRRAASEYQLQRALERRNAYSQLEGGPNFDPVVATRHEQRVARLTDETATLYEDQADLAEQHRASLYQENEYARRTRRLRKDAVEAQRRVADELGIAYTNPTLDRPVPERAQQIGAERQRGPSGAVLPTTIVATDVDRIRDLENRQNSLKAAVAEQRAAAVRIYGSSAGLGRAADTAAGALTFAGRGLGNTVRSLKGIGIAMATAIGPLEAIIAIALTVYETYKSISGSAAEASKAFGQIGRAGDEGDSPEQLRAQADKLRHGGGIMDRLQRGYAGLHNALTPDWWPGADRAQTPGQQEADAKLKRADAIEAANRHGVELTRKQISDGLEKRLRAAGDNQAGIDAAFETANKQLSVSRLALSTKDPKAVQAGIASFKAYLSRRANELALLRNDIDNAVPSDLEGLTGFTDNLQTVVALRGFRGGNIKTFITGAQTAIINARKAIAGSTDPEELKKAQQIIAGAEQTIQQAAQERLQRLLASARTPAEQHEARQQYIAQMRDLYVTGPQRDVNAIAKRIDGRKKQIADLQKALDEDPARQLREAVAGARLQDVPGAPRAPGSALDPGGLIRLPGGQNLQLTRGQQAKLDRLRELRAAQKADNQKLKELADQLGISRDALNGIIAEQNKADAQARLASFDAVTEKLQSETADPTEQLRIAARRAQERTDRVREDFRKHLATIDDLEQAIARQNQALQQLAAQQASDFQSQQGVDASRFQLAHFTDQGAILNNALRQARDFQNFVKGQGNKATPDLIRQAAKGVTDAQLAVAQYARDQARAMVSARADVRRAGTDDPVKQAQIDLDEATKLAKFADSPADKTQARAKQLQARRALRTRRYEATAGNIDFDLEMDKIDNLTAADRYEALAARVKGNTALKRQYLVRAKQLRDQANSDSSGFDLDVGSIKMPTVVDVRRAFASIGGQQRALLRDTARQVSPRTDLHSTVNQLSQAQVDAEVNVYVNDPNAADQVYTAIERAMKTAVKAKARNAGRR